MMFQPTRPHGARPRYEPKTTFEKCFNPRARMGRDCLLGKWLIIKSKVNSFCEHGKGHRRLYVYFFVNKRNCLNLSFCESHGVSCNGDSSQK